MKWKSIILLLQATIFLSLTGCVGASSSGVHPFHVAGLFADNTLIVGGLTRRYDYYLPANLGTSSRPLVFLFHGGGSSPDDLTGASGYKAPYKAWMDLADKEKFILVYPEGTVNPKGGLGWNDCRGDATTNPTVDDVAFVGALIDRFSSSFNINTRRIYASGTSNGGHMALRLALELSNRIAAVAPVVAAMPARSGCAAANNPISVLFMNGTADPLLPYTGGEVAPAIGGRGTVLSAQASIDAWLAFNKTDRVPLIDSFPDIEKGDHSAVKRITYANGREGTEVVFYEISGGGHVEPSIVEQYSPLLELYLGKQNHDIEMAQEIWNFFKAKTL